MSDIEILHAITGLVDQIEDNELRTGMQFIIGSIGLTFTSDAEAQQSRIDLLVQWVQQDCPWDKEVILEIIERERTGAQ